MIGRTEIHSICDEYPFSLAVAFYHVSSWDCTQCNRFRGGGITARGRGAVEEPATYAQNSSEQAIWSSNGKDLSFGNMVNWQDQTKRRGLLSATLRWHPKYRIKNGPEAAKGLREEHMLIFVECFQLSGIPRLKLDLFQAAADLRSNFLCGAATALTGWSCHTCAITGNWITGTTWLTPSSLEPAQLRLWYSSYLLKSAY